MHRSRFVVLSMEGRAAEVGRWAGEVGAPDRPALAWLLVSANNRVLGRSGALFGTVPDCHVDIDRLRARHGEAVGTTIPAAQRHRWAWRLELPAEGGALAISGRSYFRQAECVYNLRRFRDAISMAGLVAEVRLRRH